MYGGMNVRFWREFAFAWHSTCFHYTCRPTKPSTGARVNLLWNCIGSIDREEKRTRKRDAPHTDRFGFGFNLVPMNIVLIHFPYSSYHLMRAAFGAQPHFTFP